MKFTQNIIYNIVVTIINLIINRLWGHCDPAFFALWYKKIKKWIIFFMKTLALYLFIGIIKAKYGTYKKPERKSYMRRFIVATHAYMAKGIVSSLELIMGPQENLKYICAYDEQDKPFQRDLESELDKYSSEDEIVIFTDLFGGSVNNEVMDAASKRKNVFVVTGTNLILLISILLASEDTPINEVIKTNIEEAKKGIIFCNETIQSSDENVELDEF